MTRATRSVGSIPLVLCYHKVERRRELGITRLSPARFARQMSALATAGWRGISLAEFDACVRGERRAGRRELLVTFDDGYRGLRDHAFPVLRDLGFGGACFVITEFAGRLNRWDVAFGGRRFAHLAWRDIERWHARGIDFGSHTATHPRLSWVGAERLADELVGSRQAIAAVLGREATCIAYPFGAAGPREVAAAGRAGYTVGFGVGGRWRGDPLRVPRLPVHCWSPRRPGTGPLRTLQRTLSIVAGRCAVGTSVWHRLTAVAGHVR